MSEITRDIEIEHKGETLHVHVHIHLSEDEVRKIVVPVMLDAVASQIRARSGVRTTTSDRTTPL